MYALLFPSHPTVDRIFEFATPHYEEIFEAWAFCVTRESLGDPLYADAKIVMFTEGDESAWTELQQFYSRSDVQ